MYTYSDVTQRTETGSKTVMIEVKTFCVFSKNACMHSYFNHIVSCRSQSSHNTSQWAHDVKFALDTIEIMPRLSGKIFDVYLYMSC